MSAGGFGGGGGKLVAGGSPVNGLLGGADDGAPAPPKSVGEDTGGGGGFGSGSPAVGTTVATPGTFIKAWHLGQRAPFPAAVSGTPRSWPHWLQPNSMGMRAKTPKNQRTEERQQ